MTAQEAIDAAVREAITRSGRAQILIARDLDITQKHLSQIMRARIHVRPDLAERILNLLGVTMALLVTRGGASYVLDQGEDQPETP